MSMKRILGLIISILLISACSKSKNSKNNGKPANHRSSDDGQSGPSDQTMKCDSIKVLEVLKDGKNAVSIFSDERRELLRWDIATRTIGERIFFPSNYLEISSNGEYILRKISQKRFQLIKFENSARGKTKVFHINSLTEPVVAFSPDARYVLIKSRPYNLHFNDRLMIYDIEYENYLPTFEDDYLNIYQMTRDSQGLLVGRSSGSTPYLLKLESSTMRRKWKIAFPKYHQFNDLAVGENSFLLQTDNQFFVYSLETGKMVYNLDKGIYFHGLSVLGKYGMFSKNLKDLSIRELDSGLEIRQITLPDEIYLSSCRLEDDSLRMVCINKNTQNQIIIWDPATSRSTGSCI